jgi:hypothetical protein
VFQRFFFLKEAKALPAILLKKGANLYYLKRRNVLRIPPRWFRLVASSRIASPVSFYMGLAQFRPTHNQASLLANPSFSASHEIRNPLFLMAAAAGTVARGQR